MSALARAPTTVDSGEVLPEDASATTAVLAGARHRGYIGRVGRRTHSYRVLLSISHGQDIRIGSGRRERARVLIVISRCSL